MLFCIIVVVYCLGALSALRVGKPTYYRDDRKLYSSSNEGIKKLKLQHTWVERECHVFVSGYGSLADKTMGWQYDKYCTKLDKKCIVCGLLVTGYRSTIDGTIAPTATAHHYRSSSRDETFHSSWDSYVYSAGIDQCLGRPITPQDVKEDSNIGWQLWWFQFNEERTTIMTTDMWEKRIASMKKQYELN